MLWNQLPQNMLWTDRLRYYIGQDDPDITRKDLTDALCMLAGMYIDEHRNLRSLEDAVIGEYGEEELDRLIESNAEKDPTLHYSELLISPTDRSRRLLVLDYLDKLKS